MSNKDLIDALGGSKVVSDALGIRQSAVSNWKKRDIPWRHRPAIARLASSLAVSLPADFWGVA